MEPKLTEKEHNVLQNVADQIYFDMGYKWISGAYACYHIVDDCDSHVNIIFEHGVQNGHSSSKHEVYAMLDREDLIVRFI